MMSCAQRTLHIPRAPCFTPATGLEQAERMAIETELKLRIAPEQLARLKRHALLKEHQVTRPATRRLYNIYYDTPKLELHQSGMALRLRRAGRQWLQTLKGGGSVKAGLHQRNEGEGAVHGAALDFSASQSAEW